MRFFWVALIFCGPAVAAASPASLSARRAAVLSRAEAVVGAASLPPRWREYPDDCSGFVRASFAGAGIELLPTRPRTGENAVSAIYRQARQAGALHWKQPAPGDLVFFRETYDRNRDGHRNDGLTHVGIVESVNAGTVTFLHRTARGIVRSQLNRRHPRVRSEQGVPVNDYLRRAAGHRRAYFTGELFAAYASVESLRR